MLCFPKVGERTGGGGKKVRKMGGQDGRKSRLLRRILSPFWCLGRERRARMCGIREGDKVENPIILEGNNVLLL